MDRLVRLLRDETGATAVEYGLIIAAIAGLIIPLATNGAMVSMPSGPGSLSSRMLVKMRSDQPTRG